ncbi:MAG TPA: hypothetical protein VGM91_00930 [Conexibacter sp.]|jgi:hypothetical protein
MSQAAAPAPGQPAHDPSDRVRLARVALDAAIAVPKVVRGEAGRDVQRVTVDGGERLEGVLAIAQPDGRYGIELRLVAQLVPLHALAEDVRAKVRGAAARAGLERSLGEVNIEFAGLLTAEERAAAARAAQATALAAQASADRLPPNDRGDGR